MACLYLDGFEHYGTDNIQDTWQLDPVNLSPYLSVSANGRTTTSSMRWDHSKATGTNGAGPAIMLSKGDYGQSEGVVGFAIRFSDLGNLGGVYYASTILRIANGGWSCFYLGVFPDGTLFVYTTAPAASPTLDVLVAGPSTFSVENDTWHYVECKWKIHATTGYITVHVDNMEIFSVTGIDTCGESPTNAWTTLHLSAPSCDHVLTDGFVQDIDDLYLLDTTGGVNDDFLGDITVKTVFVDGDGNYGDWTPSTPGDHYVLVDEADPDDETTYVETDTVNNSDTYTFADIPVTDTVLAVMLAVNARKTDEGTAGLTSRIRYSSTDYDAASNAFQEPFGLGGVSEYYYIHFPWDEHPLAGGTTWSPTLVNDSEFGFFKSL